jgi:uncharacterized coiled-coil protein SlyX
MKLQGIAMVLGLLIFPFYASGESLSHYQEEIEKIFLREAVSTSRFKEAVQTARLLGYLEFMAAESFAKFHECMTKEKTWNYLSAKRRESLLNNCRGKGRMVSGAADVIAPTVMTPAANEKQEQNINELKRELTELRSLVERLSQDVKRNHDSLTDSIGNLERGIASPPAESPFQMGTQ